MMKKLPSQEGSFDWSNLELITQQFTTNTRKVENGQIFWGGAGIRRLMLDIPTFFLFELLSFFSTWIQFDINYQKYCSLDPTHEPEQVTLVGWKGSGLFLLEHALK